MKKIYAFISFLSVILNIKSQSICDVNQLPTNLQNGLIAFYPFCGNPSDVTSNAYNGTVYNATLTTDRFGNSNSAYNFNATNSRIDVTNSFFNPSWTDYTISAWFSSNNSNKLEQEIFNTVPHNSLGIGYNYSGAWTGYCVYSLNSNSSNGSWDIAIGQKGTFHNYIINNWYHVVLVKNGTTWKQYINGNLENTFSNSTTILNANTGLRFGSNGTPTPSEFFSGKLDDYMIYNRALSANEIATLYNGFVSVKEDSESFNFLIYPNPSSDNFTIEYTESNYRDLKFEILDVLGQKIHEGIILPNAKNNINFNGSNGIYFVKVLSVENKILSQRRIIICK